MDVFVWYCLEQYVHDAGFLELLRRGKLTVERMPEITILGRHTLAGLADCAYRAGHDVGEFPRLVRERLAQESTINKMQGVPVPPPCRRVWHDK